MKQLGLRFDVVLILNIGCLLILSLAVESKYTPDWSSLDKRPTPPWFDKAKFGIFIHWGVFSVPSFGSEWFWELWKGRKEEKYINFMKKNYPPSFTYPDFAPRFTAEFFDSNQWADIIKASGARYVVVTSKHHEGFTLWPSSVSWNWNSLDVGPKRDLIGEIATSVRNRSIHFGLYHSLYEWFNRLYLIDKNNYFKTQYFVKGKTMPELYELILRYKPEVLWSDGDWEALPSYWNSTEFLAWLFNDSPVSHVIATNDRWGLGTSCKHGGYYNCYDKYNPRHLLKHKWENALTLDKHSWGYRREANYNDILTLKEILTILAETVSCGGNFLLNIGPTHDGKIVPIFEERLKQIGKWLNVNGEAIFETKPWIYQNDTVSPVVWYTSTSRFVYAILLEWPENSILHLGAIKATHETSMRLLGYENELGFKAALHKGVEILLPSLPPSKLPSQTAWVIKIHGINTI